MSYDFRVVGISANGGTNISPTQTVTVGDGDGDGDGDGV